jgi:hypothetical protein
MEMSQNGIHIMNNNDVLVCGSFSLMRFNPERLIKSYKIATPNVRITAIQTSTDNFVWINKQSNSGNINIYKKERFLKIEYVANSISLPDMLLFRYRLKGFSGKWSQPTNQRTALYTNLSAGNYTFEVQCSIDGVHWSRAAGSPPLHFIRPLWQRWWAIAIYAIIAILTVMLITRYYLRQKEKKRIELLQRAKLENELHLKNLRSRVIPHFTKNVLSAIGHFAMTEKLKASHYISVFSKFSENTLHFADKNYIKLSDEINYTMQYLELEKIRFEKKNFEFKLQISENTNQDILIPALTLHTYCDNAIRHGLINKTQSDWEIILDFEKTDLGTIIRVTDNGIGRQKAQALGTRGNGQGLLLIQQQILFYNSANRSKISQEIIDLTNEEGECAGTQIMLFIPDNYSFN